MSIRRTAAVCALALAALAMVEACYDLVAPLPPGAVRFDPPPSYSRWWALTEACSRHTGRFAAYSWYIAPGDSVLDSHGNALAAYTSVVAHRVVVAAAFRNEGGTIRHEMLHALLGPEYAIGGRARQHPPEYFQGRCAGVVYCDVGCLDAGRPPSPAPSDAPTLPLSDLDLHVDVLPSPVSRTGPDDVLTLVIRVTNPRTTPRWVPLDSSSESSRWVRWYALRIVPADQSLPIPSPVTSDPFQFVTVDTMHRAPFAGGQTRWLVVDLPARVFAAGEYLAVGFFNTREAASPLRVLP